MTGIRHEKAEAPKIEELIANLRKFNQILNWIYRIYAKKMETLETKPEL